MRKYHLDGVQANLFAKYLLTHYLPMGLPFVLRIQGQASVPLSPQEKDIYLREFTTTFAA